MRFIGLSKHGMYVDDCDGVHPDVIDQYYGVHGPELQRAPGESGAGQLSDEVSAEEDWADLGERIAADQRSNFRHEPVEVPEFAVPFLSSEQEGAFHAALAAIQEKGILPDGYGLHDHELDSDGYPSFEIIKSGRRGAKELRVALPVSQWRPRAELWGQALDILTHIQLMYNNE